MERRLKEQLPVKVQRLVDDLERFADLEIGVKVDPNPVSTTDPNPDRLAADITQHHATILLRSEDDFPPHSVLHELLHVHRWWIERVPQVMPIKGSQDSDDRWSVTSQIENALEHLVIVPREADYGFDPFQYWNDTAKTIWGWYPWPDVTDPWARRKNCLLGSLSSAFLVNDVGVKQSAERCLREEGLLAESQRFTKKIGTVMNSKPHAVSAVLRFLKIPFEDVRLVGFDVKSRTRFSVEIPKH